MFLQTVALIPAARLGERPHRERFNAGGVIQIILELTIQRHLTRIYDTGHTFLTLPYQARYTRVLIINYILIGFLVDSLYVISSQLPCAPNLVASPNTRTLTSRYVQGQGQLPDFSNSVFYRGFDSELLSNYPSGVTNFTFWIDFNASYCNAIYGRENTIKPLSRSCKFAIRYI